MRKSNDSLNPKERVSLLKLVLGMAIHAYKYDTRSLKSSVSRNICSGLSLQGIKITEETVLKWLNTAKEAIDIEMD